MAVNAQPYTTDRDHGIAALFAVFRGIGAKATSGLRALQTARMQETLSRMSDHHLEQIGISRSDIPNYAEKLMAKE